MIVNSKDENVGDKAGRQLLQVLEYQVLEMVDFGFVKGNRTWKEKMQKNSPHKCPAGQQRNLILYQEGIGQPHPSQSSITVL